MTERYRYSLQEAVTTKLARTAAATGPTITNLGFSFPLSPTAAELYLLIAFTIICSHTTSFCGFTIKLYKQTEGRTGNIYRLLLLFFLGRYQRTDKGQVKVLQIRSHTGTRTQSRNQLTTTRQHTPQQPGKPAASPKLTGKLTAARWPNPSAACCAKPALLPPGRLREHKFS